MATLGIEWLIHTEHSYSDRTVLNQLNTFNPTDLTVSQTGSLYTWGIAMVFFLVVLYIWTRKSRVNDVFGNFFENNSNLKEMNHE